MFPCFRINCIRYVPIHKDHCYGDKGKTSSDISKQGKVFECQKVETRTLYATECLPLRMSLIFYASPIIMLLLWMQNALSVHAIEGQLYCFLMNNYYLL